MNKIDIKNTPRHRGIYLLPNLFTTIGLFAGFYSIVAAMKHISYQAIIAVYVAMIADALDGRVARLTGTQSAFGAQFDSLADMIGFGIAPALVAYSLALQSLGKIGWLIAFLYTVATALRLARFNVRTQTDKRYFIGLPCPAAAALVMSFIWMGYTLNFDLSSQIINIIIAVVTVLAAGLMTSNIHYFSFKDLDFIGNVPFFVIMLCVLIVIAIALNPPWVLLIIAVIYTVAGPIVALRRRSRRQLRRKKMDQ